MGSVRRDDRGARRRRRFVRGRLGWLMALGALVAACPPLDAPPVSARCTEQFAKCKLPDGPLGVCMEVACKEGAAAPCFKCTSQH